MPTEAAEKRARHLTKSWIFLTLIILLVILIRVRLLDVPLERDEGEYAYMGQLILQGIPPYAIAYNMKFPGTYIMYALIMSLFGQNIQAIHIGLMIVNCFSILLVFFLARRIVGESAALAAAAAYALLSLSPTVLGFAAHATQFVVLPAIGGALVLLTAARNNKLSSYFLSGVLFGLATLMKQPGIFFFLFGATYIVWHHFSADRDCAGGAPDLPLSRKYSKAVTSGMTTKRIFSCSFVSFSPLRSSHFFKTIFVKLGIFAAGGAFPFLVTVGYLYAAGAFEKFWFWTFEYASKYGSQIPLSGAFSSFRKKFPPVMDGFFLFWLFAGLGLIALFFHRGLRGKRAFVLLFTLFSFLSVCPGFYFRDHYFVPLLPAVSVLTGVFIDFLGGGGLSVFSRRLSGNTHLWKFIGLGLFIAAASAGISGQAALLFRDDPIKISRTIYGANPFPESIEIARFIEAHSSPADKVAVFGSEPQIFFYSKRHSATGYIYVSSLMEKHEYALSMQKEMIREVISSDPKFVVAVSVSTSWLMEPYSEKYILGWIDGYVRDNYSLVGVADIVSLDKTVYKWYEDARTYDIQSSTHVLIFEKKGKSL